MIEFVSNPIEVLRTLGQASSRKAAAVAYVTQNHLQLSSGDMLICDASDRAIESRQTDRELLARLVAAEVDVFSCNSLHTKLVVFDHNQLFIGSANLSRFAERRIECGLLVDNREAVADAEQFMFQLAEVATPVNDEFIAAARLLRLADTKPAIAGSQVREFKQRRRHGDLNVRYWFFKGVRQLSAKAQKIADQLELSWKVDAKLDALSGESMEIDEDDDPPWFAALQHHTQSWKRNVRTGDKVLWCYEDPDWGWIVLPPRTVKNSEPNGKALIVGTEGKYWDDYRSLYLDTVLDRLGLPANASLREIPSTNERLRGLLGDWESLIE